MNDALKGRVTDGVLRAFLDEMARTRGQAEYLQDISEAKTEETLERFIGYKDEQINLLAQFLGVATPRSASLYIQSTRALVIDEARFLERIFQASESTELPNVRILLNEILRLVIRSLMATISLL